MRERRALGKKAVAGMNRVGAERARGRDDRRAVEIRFGRRARADAQRRVERRRETRRAHRRRSRRRRVRCPSSRAPRAMRIAISPRLAMSSRRITDRASRRRAVRETRADLLGLPRWCAAWRSRARSVSSPSSGVGRPRRRARAPSRRRSHSAPPCGTRLRAIVAMRASRSRRRERRGARARSRCA